MRLGWVGKEWEGVSVKEEERGMGEVGAGQMEGGKAGIARELAERGEGTDT
jgi:hypothetical protein